MVRRLGTDAGDLHPVDRDGRRALPPEGRGAVDQGGGAVDHPPDAAGRPGDPGPVRLRQARLAAERQRVVDRRDQQPLPRRHRRDFAAAPDPLDAHHRDGGRLLVEPLPRAAQPEGVPRAHPAARSRDERHVCGRGPDPLLHLLRDRAAPDVLHDRRVGRPQPRVRVDQVLPLHAVRLGVDAVELPGDLLPQQGADVRHRAIVRAPRGRHRPRHADPALCRALPRVRDQGADVSVPHVVARCAHRGSHGGFGAAGRHPPEARDLRLHPHRPPAPARSRAGVGTVDRVVGGDRDHLRRPVLSRADRHETIDRVLLDRAHGLRDARHRDAHGLRDQRRRLRHGGAWPHHRHALLRGRVRAGALRHPRAEPPRRHAHPGAPPRLDPRLLRHGLPRPPRARRVLG